MAMSQEKKAYKDIYSKVGPNSPLSHYNIKEIERCLNTGNKKVSSWSAIARNKIANPKSRGRRSVERFYNRFIKNKKNIPEQEKRKKFFINAIEKSGASSMLNSLIHFVREFISPKYNAGLINSISKLPRVPISWLHGSPVDQLSYRGERIASFEFLSSEFQYLYPIMSVREFIKLNSLIDLLKANDFKLSTKVLEKLITEFGMTN